MFLLGILASTAPCQITTNIGAIGFISKDYSNKHRIFINTFYYSLAKILVFLIYGILIVLFNIQLQKLSIPFFSFTRKFIGPIVMLIGFYLLGILKLKGSIGISLLSNLQKITSNFKLLNSSFAIGIIFSLAFCPTLFWLFFGIVVPLSIKSSFGLILPVIFALGTLVPLLLMIVILTLSNNNKKDTIKQFKEWSKVPRIIGSLILIIFGILDTLIYWFI